MYVGYNPYSNIVSAIQILLMKVLLFITLSVDT